MKLPTEPGIYPGLSRQDYDLIDRVNATGLLEMKRSAFHYRQYVAKKVKPPTDPMRVGSATHVYTLEPERARRTYVIWDGAKRQGKEWDKFEAKAKENGCEILTEKQYETVQKISTAALASEHAAKYLRGGLAEVTILFRYTQEAVGGVPGFSIDCKARLDFGSDDQDCVVDLKTSRDASPAKFARSSFELGYHLRAAFYVDALALATGRPPKPYRVVAVENQEPYAVQVFRVPELILAKGRDEYRGLLQRLADCRRENRWPCYGDGELDLELPPWEQRALDEDADNMDIEFEEEVHAHG